ncbi:hypothetical protein M5U04_06785 [Xenorhabdus sp. XENO-1]|uniref:hypothetical protein n=1 Tax=Xenorhabdus bovienii TaxID=40576 RepID=UPI0020CA8261|nr:hypothetical protein [Xenorhabdus bovienii]MCP9267813.1 hypothetical protein [Xenorhabdus bovienii subsp. africana]
MNKIIKVTFIALFFLGLIFTIPILFVDNHLSYTKHDFIRYNLFTFDEIKKIPIISNNYIIYYDSPDGLMPMTNSILFSNVNPNCKIKLINYIEKLGYIKDVDAYWNINGSESWSKGSLFIQIKQNDTDHTILFSVEKH